MSNENTPAVKQTDRWKWGTGLLAFAIALCIAVAVNVLLRNVNLRADLTEDKLYRLSAGTREILADLEEPVSLMFFFSRLSEVPPQVNLWARRVEDLLEEYERNAPDRIRFATFDPRPDSEIEEMAMKYGLMGQPVGAGRLYLGLVVSMGDRHEVIPVVEPSQENLLEYNITRMIARVAMPEPPTIGVLSSLPVLGDRMPPMPMPNAPQPAQPWFAFRELRRDYQVREIETPARHIDESVRVLLIVHPKNLDRQTLFAIDQYVLRGGSVILFVDPFSRAEAETQPAPRHMQFQPKSSNLDPLLQAWGVRYDPGKVVADIEAATRLQRGPGEIEESLIWLTLRQKRIHRDDIVTAGIGSIMMPFAGALRIQESAKVEAVTLIESSESSALLDAMTAQMGGESVRRQFVSGQTPLPLAVRLHGRFDSAFPAGRPDPEKEGEPTAPEEEGLKESDKPATLLIVADVDMLYDESLLERNMFGSYSPTMRNQNLFFLANMVEQLAGGPSLTDVRTRGQTDRPFTRVLEIEKEAAAQYMEEETLLQKEWEAAQKRLREIEAGRGEDQRLILSRRQQEEIERFRKQVAEAQRQLRLVRRKRTQDIERLGLWVKTVNIAVMPLAVILGGIGFWLVRRRRMRRA
jgi:ABC-type uncharacterized transport system involved in gliding motility auxiliary subunit